MAKRKRVVMAWGMAKRKRVVRAWAQFLPNGELAMYDVFWKIPAVYRDKDIALINAGICDVRPVEIREVKR